MKLNDIFGDDWFDTPRRKVVEVLKPQSKPYILDLYRGFALDLDSVERRGDSIILSPSKSEQGLIWFTHKFINVNSSPDSSYPSYIDYAINQAKKHNREDVYLLKYPLKCTKHTQTKVYDDGSTYDDIPSDIIDKTNPYENCRFHMGIELPRGWVFTYKNEKFIGCSIDLKIEESMLSKL